MMLILVLRKLIKDWKKTLNTPLTKNVHLVQVVEQLKVLNLQNVIIVLEEEK